MDMHDELAAALGRAGRRIDALRAALELISRPGVLSSLAREIALNALEDDSPTDHAANLYPTEPATKTLQ